MKTSTKIKIINFVKRVLSYKETPEIYPSIPIKYRGVEYELVPLSECIEISPESLLKGPYKTPEIRAEELIKWNLGRAISHGNFIKIEKFQRSGFDRRWTIIGRILVLKEKQQNNEKETSGTY